MWAVGRLLLLSAASQAAAVDGSALYILNNINGKEFEITLKMSRCAEKIFKNLN